MPSSGVEVYGAYVSIKEKLIVSYVQTCREGLVLNMKQLPIDAKFILVLAEKFLRQLG